MAWKCIIMCCLSVGLLWTSCPALGESPAQQENLTLKLSMQQFDPAAENIIVRVDVTNTGGAPLVVPHVSEKLLKGPHIRWAGWGFFVQKCPYGGDFYYGRWRPPPPKWDQLIELKPGEGFSFTANLSSMLPMGDWSDWSQVLRNLRGQYEVHFGYNGSADEVLLANAFSKNPLGEIWRGRSISNALTFVITHGQPRMYFPGEQTSIASPDPRYVLINVEGARGEPGVSLGQNTLYLRETATEEQISIYTYVNRVEVLWSPKGRRVLINDYQCDGGVADFYSFPLIFVIDRRELIDVREQFWQTLGDIFSKDAYFMGTKWLSENHLVIEIVRTGDRDEPTQWYEYHVLEGTFRKLDQGVK